MVVRFSQEQKDTMNRAYITAGQSKPNKTVRQGIADQFGCSLDRINEYFKYLVKKSKKSNVTSDGFKHHHLSSSFSNTSEHSSHSPRPLASSETPPPTHESKDTVEEPIPKEEDPPTPSLESKEDSPTEEDLVFKMMLDQYISFPESP
ncbi:unnamed protein product [Rhizoctonia solani]|uniref:Homeobox domain-containing protein n=1 Tax=Rhizoctonia solani TaxID=456999 RepID=A0A8H3D6I7_9AGAM|nr:unnamed protein product [Rhizoctonia solani]